ncbi:type II toxin-antitoxin system RelE/ParE family toxin [Deinococcus yunweiensis]|uniref:type II toxin-antitoxin system RelE/ParE family toxin n=1 Tax=Deinococcus yunweiensis TaxID=367282 RepID=UPI00398F3457
MREGTWKIRLRDDTGAWRVMYVATFEEGIYVLHRFQKTTRATTQHDRDIASARYRAVIARRAAP